MRNGNRFQPSPRRALRDDTVMKGSFWICSLLLLCLTGCTISNHAVPAGSPALSSNPAPQLSGGLSPASTAAGSTGFDLTVTGSNFSATCVVLWNAGQLPTRIVSSSEAIATVAPTDVAAAGTATISIMDTSTGLKSNTVTFVITAPVITAPAPTAQHQTTLFWTGSSSPVVGYNVYRGTQSGGPYALLSAGSVTAEEFVDSTVASGLTYFYVVTAVSSVGVESAFSNEAVAVIPTP